MIHVSVTVSRNIHDVWHAWNSVSYIKEWAFASDDWAAEGIKNDVRVGGHFKARNFAKDGSMEFLMQYTYDQVEPEKLLTYTMDDRRKVRIEFTDINGDTKIDQMFDPEAENSEEMQRIGWQAYLDNFKKFAETSLQSE